MGIVGSLLHLRNARGAGPEISLDWATLGQSVVSVNTGS